MLGGPGSLERALRESSVGHCLQVRAIRSLQEREFAGLVRAAGLVVLHQDFAGDNLVAVCAQLRRCTHRPLLVLISRADEALTVEVLRAGADDCLPADTASAEIIARLRAQLRRDREYSATDRGVCYELGDLVLDTATHEVAVRGRRVALTPKEFELCSALAAEAGRAVRREDLLRDVFGYGPGAATRTLDVHIGRLRQKVERHPARPEIILTVPGVGYKLVAG